MAGKSIERRDFLRRAGITGLAVAGSAAGAAWLYDPRGGAEYFRQQGEAGGEMLPSFRVDRADGSVDLAISRGRNSEGMVRAALGEMGGIEAFVQKDDVVVLKPNVAFDRAPVLGATTSPEVLKGVARLCREAGARKIIVADNPINQPEGCFYKSGIQRAAGEVGAELMLPKPSAFKPLKIDGEVLSTWPMFHRPFEEATKVIGVAPCKDHNLCSGSMTMKNWYGLLGGRRNQFHQHIHGIISDFPHMIKPTLVVLDATRVLMRNGPTGGSMSDVAEGNTLVVGTDMVAVDTVGYGLLGRDPAKLEYLHKAEARGLGTTKWRHLNWREIQVG
ncbi:MAG: DUF362 domain-containing protein [Candidatus Latescibacteria bacterium]|nr:DUF362 domain-containing protein [Candidatus Latescibacterota bacterium]